MFQILKPLYSVSCATVDLFFYCNSNCARTIFINLPCLIIPYDMLCIQILLLSFSKPNDNFKVFWQIVGYLEIFKIFEFYKFCYDLFSI